MLVDPATMKEESCCSSTPRSTSTSLGYWRQRKVVSCATFTTWKSERKCFDPDTVAMFSKLEQKLPGYEVNVTATNKAEDLLVIRTSSDRTRGSYYLYERASDKLTKLADAAPWIDEKRMAEMKPISYKSRDGLTINGYLTLPKDMPAKGLPVVVNPHGGPWAPRRLGLRSRGAVPGQPRLCRAAAELPRLDGLRPQVLGVVVQRVGRQDAGRRQRWREVP